MRFKTLILMAGMIVVIATAASACDKEKSAR